MQSKHPTQAFTSEGNAIASFPSTKSVINYLRVYGNEIVVFKFHIMFSNRENANHRSAEAYHSEVAADGEHLIIFCRNPFCLQILNLRGQGLWVLMQREGLEGRRIRGISVSSAPDPSQLKRKARKLYILIEDTNCLRIKIIQFESHFEEEPKEMNDTLQQTNNCKDLYLRPLTIFNRHSASMFIAAPKGQMLVHMVNYKSGQLCYDYAPQEQDGGLQNMFISMSVIGIAEGESTWSVVCRERNSSISVLVYSLQRYSSLSRRMYHQDDSFIKKTNIDCHERQFIRIRYSSDLYVIETSTRESQRIYFIRERSEDRIVPQIVRPIDQAICSYSVFEKNKIVYICSVVGSQIIEYAANTTDQQPTKLVKQQPDMMDKKVEGRQGEIARFEPVQEEEGASGKSTVTKKNHPISQTSLEDQKDQEEQLEVPTQLNMLVSFGEPNPRAAIKNQKSVAERQQAPITDGHRAGLLNMSFGMPAPAETKERPTAPEINKLVPENIDRASKNERELAPEKAAAIKSVAPKDGVKAPSPVKESEQKQKTVLIPKSSLSEIIFPLRDECLTKVKALRLQIETYYPRSSFRSQSSRLQPVFSASSLALFQNSHRMVANSLKNLQQNRQKIEENTRRMKIINNQMIEYRQELEDWAKALVGSKPKSVISSLVERHSAKRKKIEVQKIYFDKLEQLKMMSQELQLRTTDLRRKQLEREDQQVCIIFRRERKPKVQEEIIRPKPIIIPPAKRYRFDLTGMRPLVQLSPMKSAEMQTRVQ